jgi:apolipoprotein N-acyltransferase
MSDAGGRARDGPRRVLPLLAVLASGAAFVASFPPFDAGGLAWVALVPLFLAAHGRSPRAAFGLGYVWGIVALGGVLGWIAAFGVAVWVIASALVAVFPAAALAAVSWVHTERTRPFLFLEIPIMWTAVEFLRSQGPLGFPWALAGESQHRALLVSQIASVTGVYGISFLVVLVNATLAALALRRTALPLAVTGLTLAGVALWGSAALRDPVPATMTAAVVQPNYATRARWHASSPERDLGVLEDLTGEAAARGATLVVWPETASPTDIAGDPATEALIRSWVRRDHISLVASSLEGGRTNSAFSFAPSGALTGHYDKVRLVPFAELGDSPGRGPVILPTPAAGLGVAICFESIFPEIARRDVLDGASVLAVLTNDAWFDGGAAPAQHAAIAPFRAIEEGRYLLRAANSGWSQIIDPRGRVLGSLLGARGVLTARIAPLHGLTPYARAGDVFGWAVVLLGAVLAFPRARAFLGGETRRREFIRLLVVSLVPLIVLLGAARASSLIGGEGVAIGPVVLPVPLLVLLAVTAVVSRGRAARDVGVQVAGFLPAGVVGLAAVAAFSATALLAFSREGVMVGLPPPPGGWWAGTAVQVVIVGAGLEWWLRGLVFDAAAAWRGWGVAVPWSALLGTVAASPRGPEAMVWGLCAGLSLGFIRARWAQVPALALAHGVGNVLLGFVISPW